jgi:nondiscriminating glutamyl-tRNA synthetase
MKVRTRIAPSPTGPQMHIGNFRTALYSYFWAKKNNGEFILRVEDTDRKRYVKGSVEGYLDLFEMFDIEVDRHPTAKQISEMDEVNYPPQNWLLDGEYLGIVRDEDYTEIYIQTQRLPLYLKYAAKLVSLGFAYPCFLTEEELEETKKHLQQYQPFRSPYRSMNDEEVKELINQGKPYVIRLNVEKYIAERGEFVEYEDLVLGKMKFDLNTIDDQVLVKSNGIPTYHLAVVIDDHNMDITHPIRGYGWLPSTPKQVMLYDMLGWEMKPFAHVTDVLDPAGGKLSKRKGAVFTTEFIIQGYLKEAIINFISLVGWTPKIERVHGEKERELFSMTEIIELFDINGISKTNPTFDREKLVWFNKEYMKLKSVEDFRKDFTNWLEKYSVDKSLNDQILDDTSLDAKLALVKDRSSTLEDALNLIRFFYNRPENINFEIKQLNKIVDKKDELIKEMISMYESFDADSSNWKHEEWENLMRGLGDKFEKKHGDVFMLLRVAIVGEPFSPPLFECLQVLGKEEVLKRLSDA